MEKTHQLVEKTIRPNVIRGRIQIRFIPKHFSIFETLCRKRVLRVRTLLKVV